MSLPKVNLDQFHRYQGQKSSFKPKTAKPKSLTKQIRDLERLVNREGMSEEIKTAKIEELRVLKKQAKVRRHAETLSTKYKKIRFIEKTKAERKLTWVTKELERASKQLDTTEERLQEL